MMLFDEDQILTHAFQELFIRTAWEKGSPVSPNANMLVRASPAAMKNIHKVGKFGFFQMCYSHNKRLIKPIINYVLFVFGIYYPTEFLRVSSALAKRIIERINAKSYPARTNI